MNHIRLEAVAGEKATETTVLPAEGFVTPWRSFTQVCVPLQGQYDAGAADDSEAGYVVLEGAVRHEASASAEAVTPLEVEAPGVVVTGVGGTHRLTNVGGGIARILALSVGLPPTDRATEPETVTSAAPGPPVSDSRSPVDGAGTPAPTPRAQAVDATRLTWRDAIHGGSGRMATLHLWRPEDFSSSWTFIDHAVLGEGGSVGYHYHDALEESFVVLSGCGWMTVGDETFEVGPGSVTFQGIGEGHGILNPLAEDLAFLRIAVGVPGEDFTTIDLCDDLRTRRPGEVRQ